MHKGGYCTAGVVTSLAAFAANKPKEERDNLVDIENILDGQLCRCTGYRPVSIIL